MVSKLTRTQEENLADVMACFSGRNPEFKSKSRDLNDDGEVRAELVIDGQNEEIGWTNFGELTVDLNNFFAGAGHGKLVAEHQGVTYRIEIKTRHYINSVKNHTDSGENDGE